MRISYYSVNDDCRSAGEKGQGFAGEGRAELTAELVMSSSEEAAEGPRVVSPEIVLCGDFHGVGHSRQIQMRVTRAAGAASDFVRLSLDST